MPTSTAEIESKPTIKVVLSVTCRFPAVGVEFIDLPQLDPKVSKTY